MNVLENDEESLVETGSHRRPFDDQLGWPTMSEPAPVLQHPSSTPQGDYTHTELLRDCAHTHLQLPPNDLSGVSRLYYTNVSLEDATAEFLDVADSSFDPPSGHQDPTEGVSLPALCDLCPLGFCPTFDGHDPSPTEGSAFPSASRYFEGTLFPSASSLQPPPSLHGSIELDRVCFSQTLPQTFSAETDVTRDTSRVLVPPTLPLSSARSYSGESGGNETFSALMAIRVSTRDSGTATTPLAVHLPDSTLNDYIPLDPYSTLDEAAPSFEHQVRRFANTVEFTPPSSRVSGRRNSKKYMCDIPRCSSGFAQRQGLNRHMKDRHLRRSRCPYCSDFEWSEGRFYLFKTHLRNMHPGAPLP
ncbi:hypothetical protein EDB83DRAFT_1410125 [Lactarius deliciosus]|nr:hypothetical protein EDB83DRAFT_1410125 [Lactarius deliciosus]